MKIVSSPQCLTIEFQRSKDERGLSETCLFLYQIVLQKMNQEKVESMKGDFNRRPH